MPPLEEAERIGLHMNGWGDGQIAQLLLVTTPAIRRWRMYRNLPANGERHSAKDETGNRHGSLTVIRRAQGGEGGPARWLCQCECGNKTYPTGADLRRGKTKTCGVGKCSVLYRAGRSHSDNYDLWSAAKQRARKAGFPFAIEPEDIEVPDICPVLGIRMKKGDGQFTDDSPTLDRIIPLKGYVPGNVAVISYRANRIKSDGSAEEHRRIADWVEKASSRPIG